MNNIKNNLLPKIYDDLENNENFIKYFNKNKLGSKRRLKYKNDYILKCLIEENKFKFNIFEKSLKEYYDLGYGFKNIGKLLNISYSNVRQIFYYLNIKYRKGYNVVTDKLKEIRRINAIKSGGWRNRNIKNIKTERGVQGYYYNKSIKKYVWIRSSWEYIYAKWLDKNNFIWNVEFKSYKINNIEYYRPDFFIFDKNNNLTSIIEIKGYWKNRLWKTILLKEKLKNINVILIENINNYLEENTTYGSELKKWKKERLLKLK